MAMSTYSANAAMASSEDACEHRKYNSGQLVAARAPAVESRTREKTSGYHLPTCFSWLGSKANAAGRQQASESSSARRPTCQEENPVVMFMQEIGLSQYSSVLLEAGFDDMETLRDIEDGDMADLGIPRGHAVKLKKRLRVLDGPVVEVERPVARMDSVASSRCMLPTDRLKTAVEQSWEQVQAMGSEVVAEVLFRILFDMAPGVKQLFPADVRCRYRDWSADEDSDESDIYRSTAMRKLFAKVVNAVGTAVAGLQDLSKLVPMLTQLGARHFQYGVKEEFFHVLGKALVRALRDCLGGTFTLQVEVAWTMVYGFVSSIMLSGMQAGSGRSQSIANASLRRGGQEITGGREAYRIERHLQKAIFGDVYAAIGLASGRQYAVKVLDREMVARFGTLEKDNQFCESPLCEVRYVDLMRDLDHVVQLEDHFADQCYHFVVSELASGGDLLEALRLRPSGFKERQAQPLIREAAKGLLSLHQRGLAMQDVSLENMLLYVLDDGTWQVRICDPGQAICFGVDSRSGAEEPVPFHGFVAKDFRPPELYAKQEYLATRVDSWCLGWSTFYLLAAQPMFNTADPAVRDPDWLLFREGSAAQLFGQKLGGWRNTLSEQACDFILRLMHIDPVQRMSVRDALRHPWLSDGTLNHAPLTTTRPGRSANTDWCSTSNLKVAPKRQWNSDGALQPSPSLEVNSFYNGKEQKEVITDVQNESTLGKDNCKMGESQKIAVAQKPPIIQVNSEVPTLLHKSKAIKERIAAAGGTPGKVWTLEAQQPARRSVRERKALDTADCA